MTRTREKKKKTLTPKTRDPHTQTHTFRPRRFSTQIDGNRGRGIYIYHFIGYKNLFEFYSRIEIKSTSPRTTRATETFGILYMRNTFMNIFYCLVIFFSALCPSDFICLTHRKVTNTGKYWREKNILYAENAYIIVYLYACLENGDGLHASNGNEKRPADYMNGSGTFSCK